VDHHRGLQTVEDPSVEHQDLAAAALFGRGSEHLHGETELVDEWRERESGTDCGRAMTL